MAKARILLLDLETTPNIGTFWGCKLDSDYLDHSNILQERYTLSASWKWLGEKTTHSLAANVGKKNPDKALVKRVRDILNSADAVIAHRGARYDIPWVNTMLLKYGLAPAKPIPVIDTYEIARKHFFLNSNSLDYLGKFLGVGQKIKTGFDLWKDCIAGNKRAMRDMLRYNREDVRLLERVYLRLRPFVPVKLNQYLLGHNLLKCPKCGETRLHRRGTGRNLVNEYARYQCQACGGWSSRPFKSNTIR